MSCLPAGASEDADPGTYEIDRSASELRILVYPAGLLKRMGHSHVIATSDIEGSITIGDNPGDSSVRLLLPVESFEVDNETLRAEEGKDFASEVSDKDKSGTRRNMLGRKLLDSSNFPTVSVQSTDWSGELPDIVVSAEFMVTGKTNMIEFPVAVHSGEGQITVTGAFSVTHRQLGLEPFRAALGSLRVRDEMEVKFRLTARRPAE